LKDLPAGGRKRGSSLFRNNRHIMLLQVLRLCDRMGKDQGVLHRVLDRVQSAESRVVGSGLLSL